MYSSFGTLLVWRPRTGEALEQLREWLRLSPAYAHLLDGAEDSNGAAGASLPALTALYGKAAALGVAEDEAQAWALLGVLHSLGAELADAARAFRRAVQARSAPPPRVPSSQNGVACSVCRSCLGRSR